MNLSDYPEWHASIGKIADSDGTVLIIGGADTGKTTFGSLLSREAATNGRPIAMIDADLGQSEIGPPACVGLGIVAPSQSMSETELTELEFVGSTTPRGRMLEHVTAVRRMADIAARLNPHLVIVDTTGFIQGSPAQRLKHAKAELLSPNHIVGLQRMGELEHILRGISGAESVCIHRLSVPAVISRKSPGFRSQRRAARFSQYFQKAEQRAVSFDQAAFTHTWLNSGTPFPPHVLKFISDSAGTPVPHAEQAGRFLGIVAAQQPTRNLSVILEHFKPESVSITPEFRFRGLLLGLSDSARLLGLGIVDRIDFQRRRLELSTPVRSIANVSRVHFGAIRIDLDGRELGILRPGDI